LEISLWYNPGFHPQNLLRQAVS